MLFKKREQEKEGEVIGEAKVVDPTESVTAARGASIDAVAEDTEVVPRERLLVNPSASKVMSVATKIFSSKVASKALCR